MEPLSAELRSQLTTLRNGLLEWHKRLLDSERAIYVRDVGPIESPGKFLNLLLEDPHFDWLRELSQMVVAIDEALASKQPVPDAEAQALIKQARALAKPDENGGKFARGYWQAMQRDPDVVLAHAAVLKIFNAIATA